jgi:serine/threonine-protein kinase
MVQPDGNVKVMDFGIARAKNSIMQKTSSVLGTAHYISPEQAQGKDLTPASDIYSLGVVLYEAATGQVPFDAPDAVSVAMKQVNEQPVPPRQLDPNIDAPLEAIILKAMSKNAADRFSTAREMRRALNDYLTGRPVNLVGFDNAETALIGVPVEPIGQVGGFQTASTSVMPLVDGKGRAAANGQARSQFRQAEEEKKRGKGRVVAIVVAVVAVIAIIAGIAFGTGLIGGGAQKDLPDVSGVTLDEARLVLEAEGFKVGKVEHINSDSVAEGLVVRQDPAGKTKQKEGTTVNLWVSAGVEQVEVPDLSNKTADEAKALLERAGLRYEAGTAEHSDSVAEGRVARQDPAAGTKVAKNSKVVYILSAGEEGTTVPDVVGSLEGSAQSTLSNAGFSVAVDYVNSSDVERGKVISQQPEAGTKAKSGSSVSIVVSLGSASYTVYAESGGGGSVYPSSVSVEAGGSATFTASPNSGYSVSSVRDTQGNSYNVSADGTFTVSNVSGELTITVLFEADPQPEPEPDPSGSSASPTGGSGN